MTVATRAVGAALDRLEGPDKVRGVARYAAEQPVDRPVYLYPVQATIATGRVIAVDEERAQSLMKLVATLEDDDDVQSVYANFEVDDETMAKLSAA